MWVGLKYCQRSKVRVWDERFSDYSRNLSLFFLERAKRANMSNWTTTNEVRGQSQKWNLNNQDVIILSRKACFWLNKIKKVLQGRFQRGTFLMASVYFSLRLEFSFMFFCLKVGKLNLCGSEMRRERFPYSEVINGENCCSFFLL